MNLSSIHSACQLGKSHHLPFLLLPFVFEGLGLVLIFTDIWGSSFSQPLCQWEWILCFFIYDFSKFIWFFLRILRLKFLALLVNLALMFNATLIIKLKFNLIGIVNTINITTLLNNMISLTSSCVSTFTIKMAWS